MCLTPRILFTFERQEIYPTFLLGKKKKKRHIIVLTPT